MHACPYHCVRTWEGSTGAGGRRKTYIINHVHAHLVGLGGVRRVSVGIKCPCGEESRVTA